MQSINFLEFKKFITSVHGANNSDIYGDWRFNDITNLSLDIEISFFWPFVTFQKNINFSEIAWKGKNISINLRGKKCICCGGIRYKNCNELFPGILIENAPNPFNLKYRMIDGKHRIEKLLMKGKSKSFFYVIQYEKIKPILISKINETCSIQNFK